MDTLKAVMMSKLRGEDEMAEIYAEIPSEASLCDRTGDNFVSKYLTKGLFKVDDRGRIKAVEGL